MKKIWIVLVTLVLCIGMMLGGVETAMAGEYRSGVLPEGMTPVWVGGVQMQIGEFYKNETVNGRKMVRAIGTSNDYNAYVTETTTGYTLYINNLDVEGNPGGLNITGEGVVPRHQYAGIFSTADNLTIVVNGTNTVKGASVQGENVSGSEVSSFYKLSDGVFVYATDGEFTIKRAEGATEATLTATGGTSSEQSAGIYTSANMTIDNVEVVATGGDCSNNDQGKSIGIYCGKALTVGCDETNAEDKTNLKAEGGNVTASQGAESYAIESNILKLNSGKLNLGTDTATSGRVWCNIEEDDSKLYIANGMAAVYTEDNNGTQTICQIGQTSEYDYTAPEVQHWATKTSVNLKLEKVYNVKVTNGKITGSYQYKAVQGGTEMYIGDSTSTSGYFIAGRMVEIKTIDSIESNDGSTFIDWKIEPGVYRPEFSDNGKTIRFMMSETDLTLTALYGYKLEVEDGFIVDVDTKANKATEGIYPVGTEITIEASQPAEGMRCTGWEGIDGLNATVVDNSTKKIKFKMPNKDVSIKAKYGSIPVLTINDEGKVCNGNDYTFTFTLPEGVINPTAGYNVGETTGGQLTVTGPENGIYTVTVKEDCYKTGYENGETTIKVSIEAETSDGYEVTTSKDVTIVEHTGGTATCTDKAVCDTCHQEYGEKDTTKHVGGTEIKGTKAATCTEAGYTGDTYCKGCEAKLSDGKSIPATGHDMTKTEAKSATCTEEGNNEYWHCSNCDKYFADADGTTEIALADTVIAKLPVDNEPATTDSDQSSETGDDFNMTLLMALLIASCGGFTATTLYRRRHVK